MPNILVSAKAIIQKDSKILLVKQTRPGRYYWDLPGGKLEYGERLEETVKREVKEETGLEVSVGRLAGVWQFYSPTNKHQLICPTYYCETSSYEVDIMHNVPEEFIQDFAWVAKSEIGRGEYRVLDESLVELISGLQT